MPTSDEEYFQCFMGLQNIYNKGESLLGMYCVRGGGMLQCFQIICTLVA
jgi:hypothetical protein